MIEKTYLSKGVLWIDGGLHVMEQPLFIPAADVHHELSRCLPPSTRHEIGNAHWAHTNKATTEVRSEP